MKSIVFIFEILFAVVLTASVDFKTYSGYRTYKLMGQRKSLINIEKRCNQLRGEPPITEIAKDAMYVLVAPETVETFLKTVKENHNENIELIDEDYSKVIISENRQKLLSKLNSFGFSWDAYYDMPEIYKYLENVSKTFPDTTKVVKGGKTFEGRDILGLRINTDKGKKKPAVVIESGIHAREWIAPATTTYFINQLLTSKDPEIKALRDNLDWHIFPTTNPDGYHYTHTTDRMWRKTRSKNGKECDGVDPNRNWDHNWGLYGTSNDSCDETYCGPKVFSEIETRTFSKYISGVKNLTAYVGFHSCAQMLLIPYSDSKKHIRNYDDLIKIGKTSLEYGYKVNHAGYEGPGTAAEMLYFASGGSFDWVRQTLKVPLAFTYELRGDGFEWPPKRIPEQGDEVTQMLLGLFTEAKNLGYL